MYRGRKLGSAESRVVMAEEDPCNPIWSLHGTSALVTGGTKGIGYAVVEELARFGATVYTCSRNEDELNECLKGWKTKGLRVTGSVCDASDKQQRDNLMETLSSEFNGKLNILVNNVGTTVKKPTVEYTYEDTMKVMTTNFESAFHFCQLAYPLLKASGAGSIVNMSSITGGIALPVSPIYASSKGALNQLTRNLSCEWAKDNIRVNAVAPGYIYTPFTEEKLSDEKVIYGLCHRIPLGRIGETNDVTPLITFLCLPASKYITGQTMYVDGGMSINGYFP